MLAKSGLIPIFWLVVGFLNFCTHNCQILRVHDGVHVLWFLLLLLYRHYNAIARSVEDHDDGIMYSAYRTCCCFATACLRRLHAPNSRDLSQKGGTAIMSPATTKLTSMSRIPTSIYSSVVYNNNNSHLEIVSCKFLKQRSHSVTTPSEYFTSFTLGRC